MHTHRHTRARRTTRFAEGFLFFFVAAAERRGNHKYPLLRERGKRLERSYYRCVDSGLSSRAASYGRHTTQVHAQAGSTATHDPQPILSARSHVPPPCGTTSHDLAHAASRERGFLRVALYLTRVERAKRDSLGEHFLCRRRVVTATICGKTYRACPL